MIKFMLKKLKRRQTTRRTTRQTSSQTVNQRTVNTVLTNEITFYRLPQENLGYIFLLKQGFELRKKRNPRYSLRKYAKDLGLTPMHLSYILRGRRGLSRKKAEPIAKYLRLSFADRKNFLLIVSALSGRAFRERNLVQLGLRNSLLSTQQTISSRKDICGKRPS